MRPSLQLLTSVLGMVLALCGCQSQRLAVSSTDEVHKASDQELVLAWIDTGSPKLKDEIVARKYFTDAEWEQINTRTYGVGTREMVVWAIKGRPWRVNETAGVGGTTRQLCYDTDSYGFARKYVYVTNGQVTSWQNLGR